MRKGIIAVILIAATYFVFPQDVRAADLPSENSPVRVPNAYEILGLVPQEDYFPAFDAQAETESIAAPPAKLPVQLEAPGEEASAETLPEDQTVETLPDDQTVETPPEDQTVGTPPADSTVEPLPEEPFADPLTETLEEPSVEPLEEPSVEERAVPEDEVPGDSSQATLDGSSLDEPVEEASLLDLLDASESSDAGDSLENGESLNAGDSLDTEVIPNTDDPQAVLEVASEEALVAEILRLMDERDQLNETINGLRQENELLSEKAEQTAFYQGLAETLEQRIAELEAQLADTEMALADSSEALLLAQSDLAEQGTAIEKLEFALAESETSLKDTRTNLDLLRDELAAAPEVSGAADVSAVAGQAAGDDRLGALAAERDAALEARTKAEAARKAAEEARTAAELSRAATEAVLSEALATGLVTVAPGQGSPEAVNGYLSGWSLDTARFTKVIRPDLSDSAARMGSWLVQDAAAKQTDSSQYFSRLELPLAQDGKPLLYSFKARATGKGWVGLGLHFFVEDVVKRRGYGEGKSLLIWFTRDQGARGVDTTYLQLYRSDNDVVMERMFDAAIGDSIATWRKVDIVYDPVAEYVAVSVDGVLRIVYKTFFGRTSGATIALRTLGGGVEFADFSVRGE